MKNTLPGLSIKELLAIEKHYSVDNEDDDWSDTEGVIHFNEDGSKTSFIIDEEGDIINCELYGDECVWVKTEELTYITLSERNLKDLLSLIQQDKDADFDDDTD